MFCFLFVFFSSYVSIPRSLSLDLYLLVHFTTSPLVLADYQTTARLYSRCLEAYQGTAVLTPTPLLFHFILASLVRMALSRSSPLLLGQLPRGYSTIRRHASLLVPCRPRALPYEQESGRGGGDDPEAIQASFSSRRQCRSGLLAVCSVRRWRILVPLLVGPLTENAPWTPSPLNTGYTAWVVRGSIRPTIWHRQRFLDVAAMPWTPAVAAPARSHSSHSRHSSCYASCEPWRVTTGAGTVLLSAFVPWLASGHTALWHFLVLFSFLHVPRDTVQLASCAGMQLQGNMLLSWVRAPRHNSPCSSGRDESGNTPHMNVCYNALGRCMIPAVHASLLLFSLPSLLARSPVACGQMQTSVPQPGCSSVLFHLPFCLLSVFFLFSLIVLRSWASSSVLHPQHHRRAPLIWNFMLCFLRK